MMKNDFYFIPESFFILKIFKLQSWLSFLVMKKNGLIRRIRLLSKFMTSHLVNKQMQHVFRNISSKKGNQTTKFSQLIECNMGNIFLEISYTKCGGETISNSLSEWSKLSISLVHNFNSLKFYTIPFYRMSSWRLSQYIKNKLQTTCFYVI